VIKLPCEGGILIFKYLGFMTFIKFKAITGFMIGIILGIIYSIGGLIIDSLVSLELISSNETSGLSIGTLYALAALLVMPILFAIINILLGLTEAFLYKIYTIKFKEIDTND